MTVDLDECIHGLGPVSSCRLCNGKDAAEAKADTEMPDPMATFPARYPSRCRGCDEPIVVGDMVAWHPDWLARHIDCWETSE